VRAALLSRADTSADTGADPNAEIIKQEVVKEIPIQGCSDPEGVDRLKRLARMRANRAHRLYADDPEKDDDG